MKINLSPLMTPLERQVFEADFTGVGIGGIMAATGKSERTVSAAFNRAHEKQRNFEAEIKMKICIKCGEPAWKCNCKVEREGKAVQS